MTDETLYSALHWAKKAEYWAGQAAQGQIQADWAQTDNTKKDFIKNKPTIPAAQVNSDWNATTGIAQILNKPTKLSDFTDDTATNPVSRASADSDGNSIKNTYATKSQLSGEKSNCITEIPQDIKLELNNGTLTLKAGSKVYNGNGLFAEVQTDVSQSSANYNGQVVVLYASTGVLVTAFMGDSVASLPSPSASYKVYYNTTDKKCYLDTGTWLEVSFPIAFATSTITEFTSIDQVFNGFCYIGSSVFALPGVKGLIPNGRNADGTLKNIDITLNNVIVATQENYTFDSILLVNNNEILMYGVNDFLYDERSNYNILTRINSNVLCFVYGMCHFASGVISNFKTKTPFHALDYNDKYTISGWGMPGDVYEDMSSLSYTAPANGYAYFQASSGTNNGFVIIKVNDGTPGFRQIGDRNASGSHSASLLMPVRRGEPVSCAKESSGVTYANRFIYAEGEV